MNKYHYTILAGLILFSIVLYWFIKRNELKPLYIIFIGAGLAIVAAIFTAWGTFLQNESSSKKTDSIKETGELTFANSNKQLERIDTLEKQNENLKADLKASSSKIVDLSEKLVEKSEYISDHLMGTGYPLVVPTALKQSTGAIDETVTFSIFNESKFPLYDIEVRVFDWNYLTAKFKTSDDPKRPLLKQEDLKKSIIFLSDQSQIFQGSNVIDKQRFDMSDGLLYIILKSRSSFLFQKIAFTKKGKVIYHKFIVFDKDGKRIKEWVGDNTPGDVMVELDRKLALIPAQVIFTLID